MRNPPPVQLLGPKGQPISSADFQNKKATPPKTGEAFGNWAGRDIVFQNLPGGGVVQFDLSKLTLADFRQMRDHYQINVSLSVLAFMQHQSDWHIECEDPKIAELCERQLKDMWTPLNRGLAQSNWAGYSPMVLQWENDTNSREVVLDKIKDLYPEECGIVWKEEKGWAPPDRIPPKFKVFDGIKQYGQPFNIPVSSSLWYPILMENGNHDGRKLLRPAFTSWFFSLLLHLFANRYYERFGEPTPIGRAPYDEDITVGGTVMNGSDFMLQLLQNLRSRSVVSLPNSKTYDESGKGDYDYEIEYLESQMRGADFERYLTRLDEEMSLGLFTPILLMRTADVGSYNLGVGHMQVYLWMMNSLNGDRKQYIDKYILSRMVDFNFSVKAPRAKIVFRKLGQADQQMISTLIEGMVADGRVKPDVKELGEIAGMTLSEIRQTVEDPNATTDPNADPNGDPNSGSGDKAPAGVNVPGRATTESSGSNATLQKIMNRVAPQVVKAFREDRFNDTFKVEMGYRRQLTMDLEWESPGIPTNQIVASLYSRMEMWVTDQVQRKNAYFTAAQFTDAFEGALRGQLETLLSDD